MVNDDNVLVTKEGYKVLSTDGSPITFDNALPHSYKFGVKEDGSVYLSNDSKNPSKITEIGKIALYEFEKQENLERVGYGFWKEKEDGAAVRKVSNSKIHQGFKEMSNVTAVEGMVELMLNQRLFDSNANVLKQINTSMQDFIKAIVS
jgi:flagellar basal body rod protein FlgG